MTLLAWVAKVLDAHGARYAVVGATALAVHGVPRATADIDLFVRPTGDNVDRLRRALRRVWQDPSIEEITAEAVTWKCE